MVDGNNPSNEGKKTYETLYKDMYMDKATEEYVVVEFKKRNDGKYFVSMSKGTKGNKDSRMFISKSVNIPYMEKLANAILMEVKPSDEQKKL